MSRPPLYRLNLWLGFECVFGLFLLLCENGWCLRFKGGIRSLTCMTVTRYGKNVGLSVLEEPSPSLINRLNLESGLSSATN